jgi:trimeric autotransporter adhesin
VDGGLILPGLRVASAETRALNPLDSINRGLIGFWPLDQGGAFGPDLSQQGRHATLFNLPARTDGPAGQARRFVTGANQYANPSRTAGTSRVSLVLWIRGAAAQTFGGNTFPISLDDNFGFMWDSNVGYAGDAYINTGSGVPKASVGGTSLLPGVWYCIAATYDGAALRGYNNGRLLQTSAAASFIGYSTLNIGRNAGASGAYFGGDIALVRHFDRAITGAEVARLYRDPWAGTTSPAARLFHAVRLPASGAGAVGAADISLADATATAFGATCICPLVAAVEPSRTTTNATSHAVGLPTHQAGQMLAVVVAADGVPTITVNAGSSSTGWAKLGQTTDGTSAVTGAVFWKVATSASEALTLATSTSEQVSCLAYAIDGATNIDGAAASGSSTNSNPPNLAPSAGTRDYLWIATRSGDSTATATVSPSGYGTLRTQVAGNTNGASVAAAEKLGPASSSEDPGTFTSANEQWVSYTLALWGQGIGRLSVELAPATVAAAGNSVESRTGDLAATLGGATLAAAGTLALAGAAAPTLSAATLSAAGALALAGATAATLDAATLAASGAVALQGASAVTLAAATLAAEGESAAAAIAGDLAVTLGAASVAAAGLVLVRADAAPALADAGLTGAGTVAIAGAASVALAAASVAASGALALAGTTAATLAAATLSAAGSAETGAEAGIALADATLAASAALAIQGAATPALAGATLAAAGTLALAGAAAPTLSAATLSAAGALALAGATAVTLDAATLSSAGASASGGLADITLAPATISAAGTVAIQAAAAITLDAATLTASSLGAGITATLAATLQDAALAAQAAMPIAGTASATLALAALASGGTLPIAGTVAAPLDAAALAAAGTLAIGATAAIALSGAAAQSQGAVAITATLAAQLEDAALLAYQSVPVVPASRTYALPGRSRLGVLAARDRTLALPARNRVATLPPERP